MNLKNFSILPLIVAITSTTFANINSKSLDILMKQVKEPLKVEQIENLKSKGFKKQKFTLNILNKKIKWFKVEDATIETFANYLSLAISRPVIVENSDKDDKVTFEGKGKVKEILQQVLFPLDYSYEARNGKIYIYKYQTRFYKLSTPAGKLTSSYADKNGSSSTNSTYKLNIEFARKIENILKNFLQNNKSKIVVEPVSGVITVYATRSEIERIEEFLKKFNEKMTDIIKIKLEIIAVQLKDEFSSGIDFSLLKGDFKSSFSFGSSNAFSLGFIGSNGNFFINFLKQFGNVKTIETQSFSVVNGFPITLGHLRQINYLRETQIGYITTQAGTTAIPSLSIRQDKIDEGTTFIIVPKKLEEDLISVNVSFEKNKLNNLETERFTIQGQTTTIQLPDISKDKFTMVSLLKKNESLILVSSSQKLNRKDTSGLPFLVKIPILRYLFGSQFKENAKYQFIVRITYEE